jgi:hypothetical protein
MIRRVEGDESQELNLLALEGCGVVVVGGGGVSAFYAGGGAGVAVIVGLFAVYSRGYRGIGHGWLAFSIGGEGRVRTAGGGYVGDMVGVVMPLVAASGLAAGSEGCDYGCGQHQS